MKTHLILAALVAACLFFVMPGQSLAQSKTIRCESENQMRKHCPVDTRGGVRLARLMGRSTCTQGTNWDFDSAGVWVDKGCRAEFEVRPLVGVVVSPQTILCESDDTNHRACPIDTRGGVRLSHQISGAPCLLGSTWGYDNHGVWTDGGCRAEFEVLTLVAGSPSPQIILCESDTDRHSCPVARAVVQVSRQISAAPCKLGSTWGYDNTRVWVEKGCRAEFQVVPRAVSNADPLLRACASVGSDDVGGAPWARSACEQPRSATAEPLLVLCGSNDMQRRTCPLDTSGGVRMVRQISEGTCTQGSTWGYDNNGIWVDNGCRAEFEVMPVLSAQRKADAVQK